MAGATRCGCNLLAMMPVRTGEEFKADVDANSVRINLDAPDDQLVVSVPSDVPLRDLLPDLTEAAVGAFDPDLGWGLTARGRPIELEASLSTNGVRDDDVLTLRTRPRDLPSDACSLPARTRLLLPAQLTLAERTRIAARALTVQPAEIRIHDHGNADPGQLALPTRTPPWRRIRTAWTDSDYQRRLDQRITSPHLTRCVTIAVLSPKGGPGKTTVTALLGSLLAFLRTDRVVAVDANPDFGSLGRRLVPQHHVFIDDLLAGILQRSSLSVTEFDRALGRGPDGLMVAPAPTDPRRANALDEAAYQTLFDRLADLTGTLVLDCGTGLDAPPARAALRCADQIVLVTDAEPDTASLVWEAAEWLRTQTAPLTLVVNKHEKESALDVETFGRAMPFARGLVAVTRDDEAATRLRTGDFSWPRAPLDWRIRMRELAVLLATDWSRLGLIASP